MTTNDLGFRIVGPCTNERGLPIDKPEADAFAPKPPGEAADPNGEADTSFDPSKL